MSGETLLKLRNASALALAYSQLISMHTTAVFAQMAIIQEQLTKHANPLPSSFLATDDDGMLQFK